MSGEAQGQRIASGRSAPCNCAQWGWRARGFSPVENQVFFSKTLERRMVLINSREGEGVYFLDLTTVIDGQKSSKALHGGSDQQEPIA